MTTRSVLLALSVMTGALAACSDVPNAPMVPGIPHTDSAAQLSAQSAFEIFNGAVGPYIVTSGIFTDEMTSHYLDRGNNFVDLDKRVTTNYPGIGAYSGLQTARTWAEFGARSLIAYSHGGSADLRARLYATQGYTNIMLAELFCSGVSLLTMDVDDASKAAYSDAVSADSLYRSAISLFDSALVLSTTDSVRTFASVGKGRALLDLGDFAGAAQAVVGVATGSHYTVTAGFSDYFSIYGSTVTQVPQDFITSQVADREGQVGLPYFSSHDPRTLALNVPDTTGLYAPNTYLPITSAAAVRPVVVADWIEARLIQAEAALHANDVSTWLQTLNDLRATVSVKAPAAGFTFDPPAALAPLADPGTTAARVDLMFAERAMWLYLTGHRQGDLRRLIRQYGRTQDAVYPSGPYVVTYGPKAGAQVGSYGTSVTLPVEAGSESYGNANYHGCFSTGA